MTRAELIAEYEAKVEQARAFDPVEVVKIYEQMLEILKSDASRNEIYDDYRYEWYKYPEYGANLWQDFIDNDVLQMEEGDDDSETSE